jgi:hypothetical protein
VHPAKSEPLTPIQLQSQETFNNSIVNNILSFPTDSHMTYLVKPDQGCRNMKTASKRDFQQKAGNGFGIGAR